MNLFVLENALQAILSFMIKPKLFFGIVHLFFSFPFQKLFQSCAPTPFEHP